MELREKIARIMFDAPLNPSNKACHDLADAILQIPELDPTPTRVRILAALGGLRDNMTPEQVKTVQWFADQFPNA